MVQVFLTAPFDAPDLIELLCPKATVIPGSVSGFRHGSSPDGAPWIAADPSHVADGIFAELDEDGFDRLSFLAQVLDAPGQDILIEGRPVWVFARQYREHADRDDMASTNARRAMVYQAADEILGYRGRLSVPELEARRPMILARAWARVTAQTSAPSEKRSAQSASDVAVDGVDATHEGFFLTRRYSLRHPVFAGGLSAEVSREVFVATDAALVLPYDPATDRVLLVEQFRMGPFGRGDPKPWVLEPVAGRVDAGETPEACAMRECEEEAHLAPAFLEHISSHYCSPGCSTEVFHCYVGICDLADRRDGCGGLAAEHEDIAIHVLDFEDAMALTRSGEINIGPLLLMLLWLERERPRLQAVA